MAATADRGLLQETEGGTIMRCSTRDLAWIARVLAGLECPFVVRHPAELRSALEQLAGEISVQARRTEESSS